jgi:hypothetical protein
MPEAVKFAKKIMHMSRQERRKWWRERVRRSNWNLPDSEGFRRRRHTERVPWGATYLCWPHGLEGFEKLNALAEQMLLQKEKEASHGA